MNFKKLFNDYSLLVILFSLIYFLFFKIFLILNSIKLIWGFIILVLLLLLFIAINNISLKNYNKDSVIEQFFKSLLYAIKFIVILLFILFLVYVGRDAYINIVKRNIPINGYICNLFTCKENTFEKSVIDKTNILPQVSIQPQKNAIHSSPLNNSKINLDNKKNIINCGEARTRQPDSFGSQINTILNHVSILISYLMLFFTFVILVSGIAVYKFIKEYQSIKEKTESVDENLITASIISLYTLPQLNYTFLVPERFVPLYKEISDIVNNLLKEGENHLLDYKNGAKILLTQGDQYFLFNFVDKAVDKWEKVYNHCNTSDDVLRLVAFRLALGYHQLNMKKKAIRFLDIAEHESKFEAFILFLKYIWKNEFDERKIGEISNREVSNIYLPEYIPLWFIATMHSTKNKNFDNAVKTLEFFARAVYDYIQTELKNQNFNLVISWLASLIGLALYFIKSDGNCKTLFKQGNVDFGGVKRKLSEVVYSLFNTSEILFEKANKNVKLYWLSFKLKENNGKEVEIVGKFVNLDTIKKSIAELGKEYKKEVNCNDNPK